MKATYISGPIGAPTIYVFPGGPGLSSKTLRSLDPLSRSFGLSYLDYQGTDGTEYDSKLSTLDVAHRLADLINGDNATSRILLGHSAGGIIAGLAAPLVQKLSGVALLSVPLSNDSFNAVGQNYQLSKAAKSDAAKAYEQSPTLDTFRNWVASYGDLYFMPANVARGAAMLQADPSSFPFFYSHNVELRDAALVAREQLASVSARAPILYIADTMGFLPVAEQRRDSDSIGADFKEVPDASHFVSFDQPESVARLVELKFATQQ